MIVEAGLIAAAVELVRPYLKKVGEGVGETVAEESLVAGRKLIVWMKERLGGRAQEAVADLEAAPDNEDNAADLRKQLGRELEARPDLAEQFAEMVKDSIVSQGMSQVISGAGAKGIQNQGDSNQNFIG